MPRLVSEVTEIVTGLGMLGVPSIDEALAVRPVKLVDLDDATWGRLLDAWADGSHLAEFHAAFLNGVAFLQARDALRGRRPERIEWRGPARSMGDDTTPVDLRVDHVYLVSCKYLSKILANVSPASLFDRALGSATARARDGDWYVQVAPAEYQAMYDAVLRRHRPEGMPMRASDLTADHRRALKAALAGAPPDLATEGAYRELCDVVSRESAARWDAAVPTLAHRRAMLWRLLRMGAAPYFVLGSQAGGTLRIRVATPWDWQRAHELRSFDITPGGRAQPSVNWTAMVRDRADRTEREVRGHVEIRWSHGRFGGLPEAKIYLDTPHHDVPGYIELS